MTARKTTPHLKRGPKPKPKPKPPKRARGRPAKPLSEQPYRYFLAYYEAFVGMGFGKRAAMKLLQFLYFPHVITVDDNCRVIITGPTAKDFDRTEFLADCDRLRALAKWHQAHPADQLWLRPMSEAVRLAATDGDTVIVLQLAASVGEETWAREMLLRIREEEIAAA
jgi:hypothetical protein